MNYHSDEWVMAKVQEHYIESLQYFDKSNIVGIFCQGSTNYDLDIETSDVDTKLIVLPTLDEIIFNKSPVSTTHIRENDEHIDFKDIRLYMQTFRKQNLNFLEILFTNYKIVNPMYAAEWQRLIDNREAIAHYNIPQAIKSMRGIAKEKYHAMEHEYPSKIEILKKYGYDPKQLHHLLRVEEYLERYINGEPYEDCLIPNDKEFLLDIKRGALSLEGARTLATQSILRIDEMCDTYLDKCSKEIDKKVDELLDDVQSKIMRKCLTMELMK